MKEVPVGSYQWNQLLMGSGKEQDSDGHASHTMHFFQDPFAGITADPQSGYPASVSPPLFVELHLQAPHDCDPEQNQSLLKLLLTTELHVELTGCKIFFVWQKLAVPVTTLLDGTRTSPIELNIGRQPRNRKSLLSKLTKLPFLLALHLKSSMKLPESVFNRTLLWQLENLQYIAQSRGYTRWK